MLWSEDDWKTLKFVTVSLHQTVLQSSSFSEKQKKTHFNFYRLGIVESIMGNESSTTAVLTDDEKKNDEKNDEPQIPQRYLCSLTKVFHIL